MVYFFSFYTFVLCFIEVCFFFFMCFYHLNLFSISDTMEVRTQKCNRLMYSGDII